MKKLFLVILLIAIYTLLLGCSQSFMTTEQQTACSDLEEISCTTSPNHLYNGITNDGGFAYEVSNGTAKITEVLVEDCSVIIPNEIDGYPVTILGSNAFYQKHRCKSIILPSTLETIESGAFYRCNAIVEIRIPLSVKHVAADAFFRLDSLQNIHVEHGSEYFCDINGVLFTADMTELVAFPEGKNVDSYVIPDSVTTIRPGSFGYCPAVSKLTIPASVTMFPDAPFAAILQNITIISCKNSAAEAYAARFSVCFEEFS